MTTTVDVTMSAAAKRLTDGRDVDMFIGGHKCQSSSGQTVDCLNPADGSLLARIPSATKEDVDRAVDAARSALKGEWGRMRPNERARILLKLADLVEQDIETLAILETLDNGKPLEYSLSGDIPDVSEVFRYFAGWATKIIGDSVPTSAGHEYFNYTLREPVGVVAAIVPWNYPLLMATWKLAPALAAGNAVILKPSELTSLSALRFAELAVQAGLPDGALSVITGRGAEVGAAISAHPGIDAVVFTGSTATGRDIVRSSAGNLKRVSLELGGKSPSIVFDDADLDEAIVGVAAGIFYNMGQDCSAGSRVYVQAALYEQFVAGLVEEAKGRRIGPGLAAGVDQGPLISATQRDKVMSYIDRGVAEGATIATGGKRLFGKEFDNGYFVEPTVFTGVTDGMIISREEIFGPVVVVAPFETDGEALSRANDTAYGLGASVWTRSLSRAHQSAKVLNAGSVWVNCHNVTDAASPFGGFGQSGYGKDLGRYALENYTRVKSVWINHGDGLQ
ncbi:aldehyde dehydrogenase family protein [Rhodococcus sp. IEGM1428]|uniref:aldehyde dehydrogenase family protein n=1 Tax=Rhodococcus sp. IEGM1428 TaxID=3392191 RepID=UPI003D09C939